MTDHYEQVRDELDGEQVGEHELPGRNIVSFWEFLISCGLAMAAASVGALGLVGVYHLVKAIAQAVTG